MSISDYLAGLTMTKSWKAIMPQRRMAVCCALLRGTAGTTSVATAMASATTGCKKTLKKDEEEQIR